MNNINDRLKSPFPNSVVRTVISLAGVIDSSMQVGIKMSKKKNPSILDHELVPKHEVLSPEEAAEILKKLKINPAHLPWITIDDPVAKAIKAKPGDIIKITRKSPTAGEIVVYRYVVVDTLQPRKKGA